MAVPSDLVPVKAEHLPTDLVAVKSAQPAAHPTLGQQILGPAISGMIAHPQEAAQQFVGGLETGGLGANVVRAGSRALGYPMPTPAPTNTPEGVSARRAGSLLSMGADVLATEGLGALGEGASIASKVADSFAARPVVGALKSGALSALYSGTGSAAGQYAQTGQAPDVAKTAEDTAVGGTLGLGLPLVAHAGGKLLSSIMEPGSPVQQYVERRAGEIAAGQRATGTEQPPQVVPFRADQVASETNPNLVPIAGAASRTVPEQQALAAKAVPRIEATKEALLGGEKPLVSAGETLAPSPEPLPTPNMPVAPEPVTVPSVPAPELTDTTPLVDTIVRKNLAAQEAQRKVTDAQLAASEAHNALQQHAQTPKELGTTLQPQLVSQERDLRAAREKATAPQLAAYEEAKAKTPSVDVSDIKQSLIDAPKELALSDPAVAKLTTAGQKRDQTLSITELEGLRATLAEHLSAAKQAQKLGTEGAAARAKAYNTILDQIDNKIDSATNGTYSKYRTAFAAASKPLNDFYAAHAGARKLLQLQDYESQRVLPSDVVGQDAAEEGVGGLKPPEQVKLAATPENTVHALVTPDRNAATKAAQLRMLVPNAAESSVRSYFAHQLSPDMLGHAPTIKDVDKLLTGHNRQMLNEYPDVLNQVQDLRDKLAAHGNALQAHSVATGENAQAIQDLAAAHKGNQKQLARAAKEQQAVAERTAKENEALQARHVAEQQRELSRTEKNRAAAEARNAALKTPEEMQARFDTAVESGNVNALSAAASAMRKKGVNPTPIVRESLARSLASRLELLQGKILRTAEAGGKPLLSGADLRSELTKFDTYANERVSALTKAKLLTPGQGAALSSTLKDLLSLRNGYLRAGEEQQPRGLMDMVRGFVSLHVPGVPGGAFGHLAVNPLLKTKTTKVIKELLNNPDMVIKLNRRLQSANTAAKKLQVIRKNAILTSLFGSLPVINAEMDRENKP